MPPQKAHGPDPGQAPYFVRPDGRSRNVPRAGRRSRTAPGPEAGPPRRTPRLTGRGGVLAIAVFSFAGIMVAHWAGIPAAPGVAFTLACLLGAVLVRPGDLLSLSVSPPIAFFAAVVAAEGLFALGSEGFTRTLLLGLASRLAEVAPWLFLGTALVLVIGVFRGLPGNIRKLGDELNGRR
ncbi:hypothetical protein A6A08_12765 [Nocardiopsis sp. TSRI0078]|uniref:DUF6542 domain-containing protein n=1 Tax=unclassified Nocardiopsis TaxID=2649073 RepID=UPI00093A7870|nr:DUF6542 domain-containing protein [Nocardiopsis sp. TSRI0078]OKI14450.1 hypothetical protein A6A08_12765 [Nocardiopsis sp. TSRI0078]